MSQHDHDERPLALPLTFDTTSVSHIVLKGAFALNAVLLGALLVRLMTLAWREAGAVAVIEAVAACFTMVFLRIQEGSRGTLFQDRVEVQPNTVLGVHLRGPRGTYLMTRFKSIRVEFCAGNVRVDPGFGHHSADLIWLTGAANDPSILLARTEHGVGHGFAQQLAALLNLSIEGVGAPMLGSCVPARDKRYRAQ